MSKRFLVLLIVLLALGLVGASGRVGSTFEADLSGDNEVPDPVVTRTEGQASFQVNRDETEIRFGVKIRHASGILSAAGAHIHCAPAGQNGPVVAFLAGVVPPVGLSGKVTFGGTLTDANILNPACGATTAELVAAMEAGDTYVNVHSIAHPGGEIRGQIEVPDA